MAYAHLLKKHSVERAFYAIIRSASAQSVPNRVYFRVDVGRSPIRIAVVRYDAAQALELGIFMLYGRFKPIVAVEIDYYSALIETAFTVEFGFNGERKIFLIRFDLQYRRVIVAKTVIRALPKIGMRFGYDSDLIFRQSIFFRLVCSLVILKIEHDFLRNEFLFLYKIPCLGVKVKQIYIYSLLKTVDKYIRA